MRECEDPGAMEVMEPMERLAARTTLGIVLRYFDEVECADLRLSRLPGARWQCVLTIDLPGRSLHIEAEGDTAWEAFAGVSEPLETTLFAAIHRVPPWPGAQEPESGLRSAA